MVHTVPAREQWPPTEHFGKDAAHTPYIHGCRVLLECQHDLGSTVPAGSHVFRHEPEIVLGRCYGAREAKITDLQIAVTVQQKVRRLQIAMKHTGRVHCLDRSQCLVDKILAMVVGQRLRTDDSMHIGLHQFLQLHCVSSQTHEDRYGDGAYLDEVDFVKVLKVARPLDIQD